MYYQNTSFDNFHLKYKDTRSIKLNLHISRSENAKLFLLCNRVNFAMSFEYRSTSFKEPSKFTLKVFARS